MSAGELHEISRSIGALEAASQAAERHREAMWRELRGINEKLGAVAQLASDVADMKPAVEDWKATKQRGLGLLAGADLGGGAIGAAAATLVKKWMGS